MKVYEKVEEYSLYYKRPREEGVLRMTLNENTISNNSFLESVQKGIVKVDG